MDKSAPDLTGQELAVVRGIAEGKTYQQIAKDLKVGFETVRTYAARIRMKLGIRSKSAIAAWAVRNEKDSHGVHWAGLESLEEYFGLGPLSSGKKR